MEKIVIAIDGHSACGKSSTAKKVAKQLRYIYLDSGAMYRAATLYFLRNNVSFSDAEQVDKAVEDIHIEFKLGEDGLPITWLNGENVEQDIRSMEVSAKVSEVSALKPVREAMVAIQRKMGENKGIVMDGRDIGSVVFPNAELKIFMTASEEVRAERRKKELEEKGQEIPFEEVLKNVHERDRMDSTRKESPLIKVEDAIVIDNSHMTFADQVEKVIQLAREKMAAKV